MRAAPTLLALSLIACGTQHEAVAAGPRMPASWSGAAKLPAAPTKIAKDAPTARDLTSLQRAYSANLSPDGRWILFALRVRTYDPKAKPSEDDTKGGWKTDRQLWLMPRNGGKMRQLTAGDAEAGGPRWLPDSRHVAFLRKHKIHVLPLDGGEARVIDTGKLEPGSYAWSPDGQSIAFTATPERDKKGEKAHWARGGAQRYDEDWRSTQLYLLGRKDKKPRQLTKGSRNVTEFAWSPDGKQFAISTSRSSDPYQVFTQRTVHLLNAANGKEVAKLQTKADLSAGLSWSPNGRYVAWQGTDNTLSLMNALRVYDTKTKKVTDVAAGMDLTLMGLAWSADSKSVLAHVYDRTRSRFARLPVGGAKGKLLPILPLTLSPGLATDRASRWAVTFASNPSTYTQLTVVDLAKLTVKQVSKLNPQVAKWNLGKAELVRWKSGDGVEIEGILTVTPHSPAGKPTPLMVMPHGGPDWVSTWRFGHWAQYFSARGYSVFQPNYRGGLGYGRKMYAANRGRLGDIDVMDIESGVDHLIKVGKVDAKRLYYGGWSYGGKLSAYTLGKTKRYRAITVGAGIVDTVIQYVSSDINHGIVGDWEYRGRPWDDADGPKNFAKSSPATNLRYATTPTLVIHGRKDRRVPFMQGKILYRALKDRGIETVFWAYPREPHGFGEPAHLVHMLERWAAWYAKH